ncbi:hypothetical protein EJ08DRAFT_674148 [Tothia fuscella]|uniref:Uncharacterized protein n=1 Tax=Tothia fuscella TaxID=1048955 RepID=A0A9P4P562_9PEZI|nr:hypothetical protein EJ08DRAFT_674148 [Tothia fuscella]
MSKKLILARLAPTFFTFQECEITSGMLSLSIIVTMANYSPRTYSVLPKYRDAVIDYSLLWELYASCFTNRVLYWPPSCHTIRCRKLDCIIVSWLIAASAILAQKELQIISLERQQPQKILPLGQNHGNMYGTAQQDRNDSTIALVATLTATSYLRVNDGDSQKRLPRHKGWVYTAILWTSRPLRPIYMTISVLNGCGAVFLALQQSYSNPGTPVRVHIPGHGIQSINYYCNDMSLLNPRKRPTIWFEGTAQHGIVDFLGIQHYLALNHGFASCSYDPPNFGRTWALPVSLQDHDAYLPALVKALGKKNEKRVHVGWDGGLKYSLDHAISDPEHTVAVIDIDASPSGIEYLDIQRRYSWNDTQMHQVREQDLGQKINKAMMMMTLGFGWGLATLISPTSPKTTNYYPPKLFSSYRAQRLKDPYWAMQYYSLRYQASQSHEDSVLTEIEVPSPIRFYAILNSNSVPGDSVSNEFYREKKADLARHIAGNNVIMQEWCEDADCTALFPVEKAKWTAGVIASMLG